MLVAAQVMPSTFGNTVRFAGAAGFALLAGVFGAPAFAAFGRAGTTINPVDIDAASALVTGGIYRISRNPMYVGVLTALVVADLTARPPRALERVGPRRARDLPILFTTAEAAAFLNRSPQTLRKWASTETGPIRPLRIYGRLAWKRSDLEALLRVVAAP